ncbi:MAG TPA: DUF4350 domain-containing protein [Pyrinomonadaceae bacterium]|nr:DUF4350 domain-containing protein [Pyrinomonadaceae bacterium]
MQRRFGIILTIVVAIGVLVAINSLAYVSEEEKQDSELAPNRSSYNGGATGTRALYELLSESGYRVMRWREAPERLFADAGNQVKTFVIVGDTRVPVSDDEAESLLHWVSQGGRLVIIDRRPEEHLLPRAGDWTVTTEYLTYPGFDTDPADPEQMTKEVKALKPAQPTVFTREVETVMPSRFMSAIKFFPDSEDSAPDKPTETDTENKEGGDAAPSEHSVVIESAEESSPAVSPAPVAHLTSSEHVLLLDYPHGQGRIVVLSDPFIVANGGIGLADNLQLALNLLSSSDGMIAFDEFHQGRGITENAFASYFAGTPVLAICGQITLLILLMLWTRGRRFARPLPLPRVDRRSSLEFVASMAELQQRARAFDLAIENVYSRTRRVLTRYAALDYNSPRTEIAKRVAERSSLDARQLETLMRQSEEAINGGAITERQSIQLVKRLREVEASLGLRMRSRDVRQSAQNI